MGRSFWQFPTLGPFFALASSLPALSASFSNASLPPLQSFRRAGDSFDPTDLSFVTKLAAIGDSYSAGIGAGERLGTVLGASDPQSDWACSRYDHAYPYLVNYDESLGDASKRTFQFRACSGAVIKDILDKQIPRIDSNQDVILLSAGGNDVELVNVLNQCIYQWAAVDPAQVDVAKVAVSNKKFSWAADFNWDALGRGCEKQLEHSGSIIESALFSSSLDTLLAAAKKKLVKHGVIYYTGYAKFWDEGMTTACDGVSWSTWTYKAYNIFQPEQKLTVSHRKKMNALMDAINSKLASISRIFPSATVLCLTFNSLQADAATRAGPSVAFVNYDDYVGYFHGRYCEAGVNESATESNTKGGLMFFKHSTWDSLRTTRQKRGAGEPLSGTFEGEQEIFAQITLLMDPDASYSHSAENTVNTPSEAMPSKPLPGAEMSEAYAPHLPDGYSHVFHPQISLHKLIARLVVREMINQNGIQHGGKKSEKTLEQRTTSSCANPTPDILHYTGSKPGKKVKPGTELRILPAGDSITVGFLSDRNGGDGNGYRLKLRDDLSGRQTLFSSEYSSLKTVLTNDLPQFIADDVVFAGTETSDGSMRDGYFAAWSGKTIKFIADNIGPSLKQRPNIVLLHAGTNDMNPNESISTEGNDPQGAANRLGGLIDQIIQECPDAVILVAMIINTCDPGQSDRTKKFQQLIPSVTKRRKDAGHHVLAVDFTTFHTSWLRDCIHPTNAGYRTLGDYWYDFITQVPKHWIKKPVGNDPVREDGSGDNGGIDRHIAPPDWGRSPIFETSKARVLNTFNLALRNNGASCRGTPEFHETGKIGLGVGRNGDWKFHKNWKEAGKLADGLGLDPQHVRLADMNGDGKADYLWVDPDTGELMCWLNNLPGPWSPAGTNNSIIGAGGAPGRNVYIADMNGDGMADYLVVDPSNGSVRIWWNYGPDSTWHNGWKFVDGGLIATGVPHANLETLRFPDVNGDGRADYVYIGQGGSLRHFMNTGPVGGQHVRFLDQGGIAAGATSDIKKLVFADMNGDGRDDYLVWDDNGGLGGFLNQPTQREGVPLYIDQGGSKSIADGIGENYTSIRLADMDGDGRDDYIYVDSNGGLSVWYNHGTGDTRMLTESIRFARFRNKTTGKALVWLDPDSGAPYVYTNEGPVEDAPLGFAWDQLDPNGRPAAPGAAPASQVQFGDVDGDGYDDYLVLDPKTGELRVFLNEGEDDGEYGWRFTDIGSVASGLGAGANVRFADIDGDGKDDYIYLHPDGGTTIYRNDYARGEHAGAYWQPLPEADASGIHQRPEEISFQDMNHDGRADYVWTSAVDGSVYVWLNNYPDQPAWLPQGKIAAGVGTSGANIKWAPLTSSGFPDYIAFDPVDGGFAAWLNICPDGKSGPGPDHRPSSSRHSM